MTNEFQAQENVTSYFDDVAHQYGGWYEGATPEGHSFRIRKKRCLELLQTLPSGSDVADIGCGPGTFVQDLLHRGFHVIGTDIAPQMIERCRARFRDHAQAEFFVADALAIPLPSESQDAVTAMGLLEYLGDEKDVLKEFHRILKPNGILIVTYPHFYSPTRMWDRLTHFLLLPILRLLKKRKTSGVKHREYKLAPTLRMIQDAGFKIQDIMFYNFKLGFRPLDRLFPALTVKLAERLERFGQTPFLRRIATGFIVCAKKR